MRLHAAIVCATLSFFLLPSASGQYQRTRVSPHETTNATVDGAELSITYGRPATRGREIFGALVPYGREWCPGADEATVLSTNRPLKFGDLKLPAGRYSLWMLPEAGEWSLIVNGEPDVWHTRYRSQSDIGRVKLNKRLLPDVVERLTFTIEKAATGGGGVIRMGWEKTEVSAPFTIER